MVHELPSQFLQICFVLKQHIYFSEFWVHPQPLSCTFFPLPFSSVVLDIEPLVFHVLGMCSATELNP